MESYKKARDEEKVVNAMIDEQNKEGPPFILEMEERENAILSKTRKLNDNKGQDNYIQMMIDKNREKQRRMEEIDDFNANFGEDLVQKWNNNNQKDFNEKVQSMMQV